MRTAFVILHYLAMDVTVQCIELLKGNFGGKDSCIVVVDNASPDGSGAQLKSLYAGDADIHFVLLPHNEGFARGNNAGYRYAVAKLDPDFVVVMNNDVMIEDPSFISGIEDEYARKPFAVLGPDIWAPAQGRHQSPTRLTPMTEAEAVRLRHIFDLKYRFYAYRHYSWKLKLRLGLAKAGTPADNDWSHPHEGCVLHGACYIFSRDFIAKRGNAFNPATFLYTEEDILQFECSRDGLAMRYCPTLGVTHLEDMSTTAAFKSDFKRNKMKYKRMVESLDVLLDLMKQR